MKALIQVPTRYIENIQQLCTTLEYHWIDFREYLVCIDEPIVKLLTDQGDVIVRVEGKSQHIEIMPLLSQLRICCHIYKNKPGIGHTKLTQWEYRGNKY